MWSGWWGVQAVIRNRGQHSPSYVVGALRKLSLTPRPLHRLLCGQHHRRLPDDTQPLGLKALQPGLTPRQSGCTVWTHTHTVTASVSS